MLHNIKPLFAQSITLSMLLLGFVIGCQTPKYTQPRRVPKTPAQAQEEAQGLANAENNPSKQIEEAWVQNYEAYFQQKINQASSEQAKEFAVYSLKAAQASHQLFKKKDKAIHNVQLAMYNSIKAIAVLDKTTENLLKKIQTEPMSVSCLHIKLENENKKIRKLVADNEQVFDAIYTHNKAAYKIAGLGCQIAIDAEKAFGKRTQYIMEDADTKDFEELLKGYIQATAMLTIALKEIYESKHPALMSVQD